MSQAVSGLAASIRNATESETFDLAGLNTSTIEKQIRDAFSDALPLTEMIRLTFVTGAGKLGRQKYDEGAAKAVTSTLRELGYEEDRGASAVLECAGTFKMQHDTGKNLKTVVVFPKVTGVGEKELDNLKLDATESLLPEGTPEHKLAYSSMNVFKNMVQSKCQSWSQKKGCVAALDELKGTVKSLEEKLMSGTPLTDSEQDFYDSVSLTSLEEKESQVRELMHKHVDEGSITAEERKTLLHQVTERIKKLTAEIKEAEKDSKPKRAENLTAAKAKAEERKAKIERITPQPPPPLKNEAEITKLRRELIPLEEIESNAKGRLLTLKESQAVSRKDELLQEIAELEQASRGWFESDEAFDARLERSRAHWETKKKSTTKKKVAKPAAAASTSNKWVTPAPRKKVATKPATKSKPSGTGGLFAAMMQDSDSD